MTPYTQATAHHTPTASTRTLTIGLLALLVGLNLRPIMAAIGPLLHDLQQTLGLSSTQASLLTTLPVMTMGLFALAGPWLAQRLGEVKGIALGLLLIALSCASRLVADSGTWLIATAVIGGLGIAMTQALMPAYLKRSQPEQAGRLMALFTTGIMGGAALAAALAAPGSAHLGWSMTLALAGVPALLTLLVWSFAAQGLATGNGGVGLPLRNPRAWLLLAFFGVGTGAYTLVLAWLPPFYVELGWTSSAAGYLLGVLTVVEVIAGLLVSAFITRFPDRRAPLAAVILLLIAGLLCLALAPLHTVFAATLCLGLGIGALFPLSLIVTLDHARSPAEAGALLAFVQGGGYLLAAAMPLVAGIVRDHSSSLQGAWWVMLIGAVVLLGMSRLLKPLDRHEPV